MIVITDFEKHACGPDTPVRDVLGRIDRSIYLFQIVVDADNRLLGTITDGDIRRAMLNGATLEDSVTACMHRTPLTGSPDDAIGNELKLRRLGKHNFLPLVDEDGRVVTILIGDRQKGGLAHALVMAGGFGARLGAQTSSTPKPLLPVGGRPILDHVLEGLEAAGVAHVHISVHYLADQIEAFVARRQGRSRISLIHEPERLGTAGAIRYLAESVSSEPLLVVNGDVITKLDYAALHDFHVRHGLDATVGVARYEVDIPFGVVRYGEDGLFAGIDEKPRINSFIAAGLYYLSPEFAALVPRDRPMDMPELLNLGRDIGLRIGLFPIHEYWTDLGRPDDLEAANNHYRPAEELGEP